jgi:branched-chain amino acid transport system ATP-binding protein
VFALAHVLTVMVNGVVLDTGDPQKVRANPYVQSAYLGRPEDHA